MIAVRRVGHDPDPVDGGVAEEGLDGMANHGLAAERQILLWNGAAESCAAAAGDDQGSARGAGRGHERGVPVKSRMTRCDVSRARTKKRTTLASTSRCTELDRKSTRLNSSH